MKYIFKLDKHGIEDTKDIIFSLRLNDKGCVVLAANGNTLARVSPEGGIDTDWGIVRGGLSLAGTVKLEEL